MMVFGIAMMLITPPFQTPDEPAHFYRIWQISTFQPLVFKPGANAGAYLPRNLNRFVYHALGDMPFHPVNKVPDDYLTRLWTFRTHSGKQFFYPFANTASNHTLVYIPQVAGVLLGRLISDRLLVAFYLGRFLNLVTWSLCILLAIRIFPPVKFLLLCLALMPMSLFQASSFSADAPVNAATFIFFALILNACFRPVLIDRPAFLRILGASIPVLIGKPGYFPLVLLIFMIPAKQFGSNRRKANFMLGWIACFSLMTAFRVRQLLDVEILRPGVSRQEQLRFILSDPVRYAGIVLHTFDVMMGKLCRSFVGVLGWMDTRLSDEVIIAYYIFILLISLTCWNLDRGFSFRQKLFVLLLSIGNLLLLMTIVYTYWMPVGVSVIAGFQGRYMIPLAPVVFIALTNRLFPRMDGNKAYPVFFYAFVWGSLTYSLYVLIRRFYGTGC